MYSPLQQLHDPLYTYKKVELWIKRDDLIHPLISGNKWRKLKYNLQEAKAVQGSVVASFGGAYSNHIHALAAAGKEYGIKTLGLIRGDGFDANNQTLVDAARWGMDLRFIDRQSYREKSDTLFHALKTEYPNLLVVPEGGSNPDGVKGVAELTEELPIPYTHLCTASGTGATAAGLIQGARAGAQVLAFSALKGNFLEDEIKRFINSAIDTKWQLMTDYHFDGYARMNQVLYDYILGFNNRHQILLDPIYNSKMMYGIEALIKQDFFPTGSIIIGMHTGGLQGWRNWSNKYPSFPKP